MLHIIQNTLAVQTSTRHLLPVPLPLPCLGQCTVVSSHRRLIESGVHSYRIIMANTGCKHTTELVNIGKSYLHPYGRWVAHNVMVSEDSLICS